MNRNDETLSSLAISFANAAAKRGRFLDGADARRANREHDELVAMYRELRRRGRDAQMQLLPLLRHEEADFRLATATRALEFAPDEALRVLEELARHPMHVAMSAHMTTELWRRGELRLPT